MKFRLPENHYTQIILYLAVLEFNLKINPATVKSCLLYSRIPLLHPERYERRRLENVINLRNRIVGNEYVIQKANRAIITGMSLDGIRSENLNSAKINNKLFNNYIAPQIDAFNISFQKLSQTEKTYFLRLYTFLAKEIWIAKCGKKNYEGTKRAACLWNASFEEKTSVGELLYDLVITRNAIDNPKEKTIMFQIPKYDSLYLPNFRSGDAVVLYERNSDADNVNNRQVLKATVVTITNSAVTLKMRYKQETSNILKPASRYGIEHDYMDPVFTVMFRALTVFMSANSARKQLLMAPHEPQKTSDGEHRISLIAGPPGTGKTSIALKNLVEKELYKEDSNILLLAYTNRATDEICRAIETIKHPRKDYIRIGSDVNCAEEFRKNLIDNKLSNCNSRKEVARVIERHNIFVATTSSIQNRHEIFNLKHFNLAIIDEASQLLEPHLLGVICAQGPGKSDAIDRFVLIGDNRQLPAIVMQSREESKVEEPELLDVGLKNLSDSLFDRIYRQLKHHGANDQFTLLTKQGRMHPDIARFPSEKFYGGKLLPVGLPHQKDNSITARVQFFNVVPDASDASDKANLAEALLVKALCVSFAEKCRDQNTQFDPSAVGIITPYRNQIALIRKLLNETSINSPDKILVDTVERFQGSQRDIIIYSFCVKTQEQLSALPNNSEETGRIVDRKLNVAITRARRQLLIVGNRELLRKNFLYKQLIEYIEGAGNSATENP
ncbi:MAG: AAA family ATPase, partial [Dysgonamonadaceae bacterium]|jgi:DNA polymerase III delta prime subunit|nr:AAA family ATPase [Dysgonamonadaceae bacterium]